MRPGMMAVRSVMAEDFEGAVLAVARNGRKGVEGKREEGEAVAEAGDLWRRQRRGMTRDDKGRVTL